MNPAQFVPYALSAIGLGASASGLQMRLWEHGEPAAGLFPFIAALLLIFTSLLCTVRSVPIDEPVELPRILAYCAALAFFCAMLEMLGFAVATFLFLVGVLRFVEKLRWLAAGLLATGVAVSTWILFEVLLSVPLPHGVWRL